jgi:MerR family transcriptional regulator, redox-sensitive transcriptional activator SoxR
MMTEQEPAGSESLRHGDVDRRCRDDGVEGTDEGMVNGDESVVLLDEGVHAFAIQAQVSLRSRPPLLTIGAVVKRSGVTASALRFYEERGLIRSIRVGTGSGHRRFGRAVLRRIAFIVFAQRIGLSLDEIRVELEKLPKDGPPSRRDWARISKRWDARVKERIAELERLRAGLTECIGCGCLSLDACPLSNPGDRASRAGPGARFWLGDPRTVRQEE